MPKTALKRLFQGATPVRKTYPEPPRDREIARDAITHTRATLAESGQNSANLALESGLFRSRKSTEAWVSPSQTEAMRIRLRGWAREEAKRRMELPRHHLEAEEPPKLHKAHAVTVEDRSVVVHLKSPGAYGRNIVAIPHIEQKENNTLRIRNGIRLIDIDLHEPTKGPLQLNPEDIVPGAKNIEAGAVFSSRQRQSTKDDERY